MIALNEAIAERVRKLNPHHSGSLSEPKKKYVDDLIIKAAWQIQHVERNLQMESRITTTREWVPVSCLGESVIVDFPEDIWKSRLFTVNSVTKSMETLEKLVGHPSGEHTKPLFEIVAALNKEVMELRLKIEKMESPHQ